MTIFSSSIHCDPDLNPRTVKLKLISKDIAILNNYVKSHQNWTINEGNRVMTKFILKIPTVSLTLTLSS